MYEMMKRFAHAVDCGGITAAANKLSVSQPAVTKSLKQLEEHYGVDLLVRGKKGVVPTESGEVVYRLAKLMEKSIEDVAGEISAKKAKRRNQLSIGGGLLWSYIYLPDAIDSVMKRNPNLSLEVSLRPPLELHDMVSDGRLDIGIGAMPEERYSGIVYEELLVSKNLIFAHNTHPLRAKTMISDSDLSRCDWIVFGFAGTKMVVASHDPSDSQAVKLSNLLLACLLMQKGSHVMRLPVLMAPLLAKFGIEPIQHKPSEAEFVSGIFYSESALLKSTSLDMINEIRSLDLAAN